MYIYIDVLIVTSVYIDFLLIKAAGKLLRLRCTTARSILAALAGSLFSLTLLLPPLGTLFSAAVRIVSVMCMVLIAFGFGGAARYVKTCIVFSLISFLFAGMCFFLSQSAAGGFILCRGGAVYFDISLTVLIISTAAAYCAALLYRKITDKGTDFRGTYTLTVCFGGKYASVKAAADTGNTLTDSVTGDSIIVCGEKQLSDIFSSGDIPRSFSAAVPKGWRFVPYNTASGSGIMPVFRPQSIYIRNDENGKRCRAEALIGVAEADMETAVFDPVIFN